MYDPLTSRYGFACPVLGETHVPLSAFLSIEQLPGAAHPSVFRVRFDCCCGEEHDGLLSHDELDWAPLVLGTAADAALSIKRGGWPWSFFCYPEDEPRPVFPSAFTLLAAADGTVRLAVRCPSCRRLSVNRVSHSHVDVPFPQRPRGGGGGTHVPRRGARDPRRVPRGALVGVVRHAQACTRVIRGRRNPRWSWVVPPASGNGTR